MLYKTVGIIGAGAWGTALAINIARGGVKDVFLWSFDGEHAHFSCVDIPYNLKVVQEPAVLINTDVWLNVTPASFFRETIQRFVNSYKNQPVIICTKGADSKTHSFMSEILQEELPKCTDFGVLSGPQFATEVACGVPTGSTLAGTQKTIEAGRAILNLAYLDETDDIIGTQIAGVGKNVVALISGFISVKVAGENERALIFTRCCNEIIKIGLALGAKIETFTGLCGLGDLFLSATSTTSRNYAGGVAIAKKQPLNGTVEGIFAYDTVLLRAAALGVKTPVLNSIKQEMQIDNILKKQNILVPVKPTKAVDFTPSNCLIGPAQQATHGVQHCTDAHNVQQIRAGMQEYTKSCKNPCNR